MNLHKCHANHPDLLELETKISTQYNFNEQKESNSVKTLGVLWDTQNDCFLHKINIIKKESYNKREVLSLISRIFDPYGLLGPVITKAKIFMQRLWSAKFEWNDLLPVAMAKDWQSFVPSLNNLEKFRIPRFIFYESRVIVQGFADASIQPWSSDI